ncbi:DNA polymerase III subunit alpha [Nitratireductor indicus C115]|uniref:Error-prone DNA polymerase n=1 Tax=Nitratireductor indicus C115 TaxID=1231190 RepID=K2NS80_9HYPH|nr:error-prone DNA polymerase [Nitratireductor indicus]EKF40589.1 DNA polymerase III subunit alpha [Nitratireductor indicus C115]SFQ44108.1 error-prone DNA polymerase [Nitratireductor indicus]
MSGVPNIPHFAELGVTSNFSFLRGGSHPRELVSTAAQLGLTAIGIADRNSLAGAVRAHVEAREQNIRLVVGVRLALTCGFEALCFPTGRAAYGRLTQLLTAGNRKAGKGECHLGFDDLSLLGKGQRLIAMPPYDFDMDFETGLRRLSRLFPGATYLALTPYRRANDKARQQRLEALSTACGTPLVATNDVLYHTPARRPLQDLLTCIREHCTIDEAGFRLERNAERHLKSPAEMTRLLIGHEDAIARSVDIMRDCDFSLGKLSYDYPEESCGESATPQEELERLTWLGAQARFNGAIPDKIRGMIAHELELIGKLDYAAYFLTVNDIVQFARTREPPILCQGRGSAANSVVCFCLGVTSVNPNEIDLLFERFISAERGEPPDIDVDFEHQRREEVMQHIYSKYGRHRASLTATVISYRTRSAVREAGKAMGLSPDVVSAMTGLVWGHSEKTPAGAQLREAGLDPSDPRLRQTLLLIGQLIGFPRHLSQHVGGFVLTNSPLSEIVPIANAAMKDRTMVEWDKDDLDALGILKVDVLSLGMLTCLRKSFDLLRVHYGRSETLASLPRDDGPTYAMIQRADTIGVFQIESRAQMSMLPRLRPENFYDLVIEIAIVRPGPIQGDMVHPYLRRRNRQEPVDYPSEALRAVLQKTYGVPLFQEQAMKIAIVAAGFSPAKADRLRRAMASFRRTGTIDTFREDFLNGMLANGYPPEFAERCFNQMKGFSEYGFPESHSASFALLAYASSFLKCHYPDVFACALLNSQPMGFYSASSIVRDLKDHGGEVLPVDINHSQWEHTIEEASKPGPVGHALRLGLQQVDGLRDEAAKKIVAARGSGFSSVREVYFRSRIDMFTLRQLAEADAFRSMGLDRRAALWEVRGLSGHQGVRTAAEELPLFAQAASTVSAPLQAEEKVDLPPLLPGEHVVEDYGTLGLSLKAHPASFLRGRLKRQRIVETRQLAHLPAGRFVRVAGLVLVRQRPGTASGVIFMTLEDETGIANAIVWPRVFEKFRRVVFGARMVAVEGILQKEREVIHVVARRLIDLTPQLMEAMQDPASREGQPARPAEPNLWRHPRNVRVLPKGRNFH